METVLAAGGGTILRYADGAWAAADIAFPGRILGITFSDEKTAWAFGATAPQDQSLFVSRDDGRTWRPAPHPLPQPYLDYFLSRPSDENRVWIRDLLFTSHDTAYLYALHQCGGVCFEQPFPVFATTDEGATWTIVPGQPSVPPYSSLPLSDVFGVRGKVPEILRADSIDQLAAPFGRQPLPPLRATAFVMSVDRAWIAGQLQTQGPNVLLGSAPNAGWIVQDPAAGNDARIDTLDFRAARDGVACGQLATGEAFCSYTSDGGETWHRSELPVGLGADTILSAARTSGPTGLALASTPNGPVVLQTADGGASYEIAAQPVDGLVRDVRLLVHREPLASAPRAAPQAPLWSSRPSLTSRGSGELVGVRRRRAQSPSRVD